MGRLGSLEVLEGLEPAEADVARRAARRGGVERLRERLDLLEREDRVLLKMHLEAGSSFDEIARVAGTDRSTVCRRIHRMIRRLGDETYTRCTRDRTSFSAGELAVVRDRFVRGLSLARIGRDHHLCYYRVRAIVQKARRCAGTT
jgi:hypothetical protein